MKIESIVLREIRLPLVHFFETSFGRTTERRIVLVEMLTDGPTGWGECTAGEHPFFSEETTDSAWHVIEHELAPLLAGRDVTHGSDCPALLARVRGNAMAKASLENALWDAEAQAAGVSLSKLLGGTRVTIPTGVSIGIQDSPEALLEKVATEVSAGYQRIKLKCKPGWDVAIFEAVREQFPDITLSCDANSAYRPDDFEHLAKFDEFGLLMIEQPLWDDDFYYHSLLQKRVTTALCLDESIRNRRHACAAIEMKSCRILNIKLGRVGGFSEAIAVHDVAARLGVPVWCGGMLESGIGRAHNVALSSLPNFKLPGDVSASRRYWEQDVVAPEITVGANGEIAVPTIAGRGYEVDVERIEKLTVRKTEVNMRA